MAIAAAAIEARTMSGHLMILLCPGAPAKMLTRAKMQTLLESQPTGFTATS
jgi:hypothetical protein